MTSCVKEVSSVFDVDSQLQYIDVLYTKYVPSALQYQDFREYLQCEPIGSWHKIESPNASLRYDKFLDAMVKPSLEVRKKQCDLLLDALLSEGGESSPRELVRLARASRILEPSFNVWIDTRSPWQVDIAKSVALALRDLVDACADERKLTRMFSVLRDILEAR